MKRNFPVYLILFSTMVLGCFMLVTTESCSKDKAIRADLIATCDSTAGTYTYQADIAPIIRANCATGLGPGTGCHDAWILSYNGLKSRVDNGTVSYRVFSLGDMPVPGNSFNISPLTPLEKEKIRCWIATGARED